MNWAEIGTQIILGFIGVVISGLGALITYFINKYVKNDKLKTIASSLNDLVRNSVLEVYQTYVEALKKDGVFDKESQEEAMKRCLNLIKKNMPMDVRNWLIGNKEDIEDYLKNLIEANIGSLKNSR